MTGAAVLCHSGPMTSEDSDGGAGTPTAGLDPKEQMRLALERKNAAAQRQGGGPGVEGQDAIGGPHGKAGGKRVFRRKAGG